MFGGGLLWSKLHLWGYRLRCCDQKTQTNGNFKKRFLHRRSRLQHVFHLWVQGDFCSSWHHIYIPTSLKGGNTMDVHMRAFQVWTWRCIVSAHNPLNKITLLHPAANGAEKQWLLFSSGNILYAQEKFQWSRRKGEQILENSWLP